MILAQPWRRITVKPFYVFYAGLLVFMCMLASTVANEADWMPDANLRTEVRADLGLADNEELTQASMTNLTSLDAPQSAISDLTGLEFATNLTTLVAWGNSISSLTPLTNLTALTEIRIGDCDNIADVTPLQNLTNLTKLGLQGNNISDVSALSGLVNLTWLRLVRNPVTDFSPLSGLKANITDVDITIPDPDTTQPTVSITVPSGAQNGAFDATITFTESVSNFVQGDVSLSGTATASITDWNTTDDTVYTATITPTTSGTVTLDVSADVATDAANNPNTAAAQQTVTISLPPAIPDPATWMPDANLRTKVRADLGLADNEEITQASMLNLTSLHAAQSEISDLTGLEFATNLTTLVAWQNDITSLEPIEDLTVLTEIRIGSNDISDIQPLAGLTALTKLGLQKNNITDVDPLKSLVNLTWLRLASNPVTDFSPLSGLKANITDVDITIPDPDTTRPTISITVPSGAQNSAFDATITFTEVVSDFVQGDVSLSGTATASITDWNITDDTVYTTTITPTTSGTVILDIAADVATDAANNGNTAATTQTVTVDVDAPTVVISVPSGTQNGVFNATITFSEVVSNFPQTDLALGGTATASITDWSTTDNTVFTAEITPTTSGTVILDIAADVATDAANNPNTAAVQQTVTVDIDKPSVTITVPSDTQNSAFDVTITFTETISNFIQGDVSLSGTATASITNWTANADEKVYTATITPTTSGTVTLDIAADVATDAANNGNTAATSQSVTVQILVVQQQVLQPDTMAPTVGISVPSGTQNSAFDATITFSESVSNFVQGDVSLSGTATASITAWSANTDNEVYTATITPTTSGTVVLNVATDVAMDAADNGNTAATAQTVTINLPVLVAIPDTNLAAAVRSQLGLTDDASITSQVILSLTTLSATNSGISNLSGLEYATSLTDLDLGWNSVSDIEPLSGLTNLTTLNLRGNQISDITHLENLTNLEELKLDENQISDISSLENLTDLTLLWLHGRHSSATRISDISPLAGLTNLTNLSLSWHQISDISSLGNLTNLTKLYLDNNSISDISSLTGLTNLTYLALGRNSISDVSDLSGLTALTQLYLGGNSISGISDLTGLTNLTKLDLGINQISDISDLAGLTNLTHLYLSSNQISSVTPLAVLVALKWLTLKDNPILPSPPTALATLLTTLTNLGYYDIRLPDPDALIPDPGLARRVRAALDLVEDAEITEAAMLGLTSLSDAGHGWNIYSLDGLEHATNLTDLRLNSYDIGDISSLAGLTNLTHLDLGGNSLDNDDLTHLSELTNLTHLKLYGNKLISDLTHLSELTNLTALLLFKCNISDLSSLSNLTNLTDLSLSDNPISNLSPLSGLTTLQYLTLHRCSISDISPLSALVNLFSLQLYGNNISDVTPIANLVELQSLKLEGNPILDTSPIYPLLVANGGVLLPIDIDVSQYPPWDVDEDGNVDATDSALVTAALGQTGDSIVNPRTDVNGDGTVDADDLTLVTDNLDTDGGAPSSSGLLTLLDPATLEKLDPATLETQLEILRAKSDGSLKYLRAIALLESVLAAMTPEMTQLLANYPNPFNPETWIPYHLAKSSDVRITIYDVRGSAVRRLELGHHPEGYYTSRSRAAYWDGHNDVGERVASGIYFYQLRADNMSLLRKMVILK